MPRERITAAQRSKIRRLATPEEDEAEGKEINVVPFLDIITNVLMFVLATVAVTFTATIDVAASRPNGIRTPAEATLDLSVIVVGDGFSLKTRGGNVATGCGGAGTGLAIPKRDGLYDFTALRDCASRLKASVPEFSAEHAVTITANPQVPYEVVIATTDALRKSPDGQDMFPDVSFGVMR